jgi:hypothetical protein
VNTSDVALKSSLTYGNVNDTVNLMQDIIRKNHQQVSKLAQYLKRDTELKTCESIWNFVFNHIQYKRDIVGREQLSTPARLWLNRSTPNTPSDCDDHSTFIGSLLYCLGIPFKIRIAGYDGRPFSHVYIVTKSNICVDTVLHRFNCEAEYSSKKDFTMQIETLHGLEGHEADALGTLEALSESADRFDSQTEYVPELEDMEQAEELNGLEGLGDLGELGALINQESQALKTLGKEQLSLTLKEYEKDPDLYHAKGFGPEYWKHIRAALQSFESNDSLNGIIVNLNNGAKWERENLSPMNGLENDHGETVGMLGALEGLFKRFRKKLKKFGRWSRKTVKKGFKAVKKGVRTAGRWARKRLKKIGKFLMKINPIMIAVRAAIRAKINKNHKDIAIKMGYGLLKWEQAKQLGVERAAWEKAARAYAKLLKKYRFMGGRTSKFRQVLEKAWRKHAPKKGLPTIALSGDLGELAGRRRRRRKRRRKARRRARHLAKLKRLAADKRARAMADKRYKSDVRAENAAKRKLKNMSKWKKEQLSFLKQIFKKEYKLSSLDAVATATTAGTAAAVAAIMKVIFLILDKLGLGDIIAKAKQKHLENLRKKEAAETDPEKKAEYKSRADRVENNLAIFNQKRKKPDPTPGKDPAGQNITPSYTPSSGSSSSTGSDQQITVQPQVSKAGMSPLTIGAMVLVGGGLLMSGGDKEKKNSTNKK